MTYSPWEHLGFTYTYEVESCESSELIGIDSPNGWVNIQTLFILMGRVFSTVLMLDVYISSQFLLLSKGINTGKNGNTRIHSLMKLFAMQFGSKLYKLFVRGSIALGEVSENIEHRRVMK